VTRGRIPTAAVEKCRAGEDEDNVKHFRENIIFFDARPETQQSHIGGAIYRFSPL